MDTARCRCLHNPKGERVGVNSSCPFHGPSGTDPLRSYTLTPSDRELLASMRIAVGDSSDAIQQVRQSDEDRWKERH